MKVPYASPLSRFTSPRFGIAITIALALSVSTASAAKDHEPLFAVQAAPSRQAATKAHHGARVHHAKKPHKPFKRCLDFKFPCSLDLRVLPTSLVVDETNPMSQFAFLTNGLGSTGNPLALTIHDNSTSPGAAVTLEKISANARGQLWRASGTGDGSSVTVWSGLGNQIALSLDLSQPSPYPAVSYPSQIPADQYASDASRFQRWTWNPSDRTIGNLAASGHLVASGEGADVTLDSNSSAGSQWTAWPSYPLASILAHAPVPFPTGSDQGQRDAYDYINGQLGLGSQTCTLGSSCQVASGQAMTGIRCQYDNLAISLSDYKSTIDTMPYPRSATFSQADFNAVVSQLNAEITAADNVRNLFANASDFVDEVFLDDGLTLDQAVADALIQPSQQAHAAAIAFVEGTTYTVLSALGPEASVLANLLSTAVSTAAAAQDGSDLTGDYVVTVSDLYAKLSSGFQTVVVALGQMQCQTLADWGKLSTVSSLVTSSGPDSLQWPATQDAFLAPARDGYMVTAMQSLLPVNYSIQRTVGQVADTSGGTPQDNGVWGEKLGTQTSGNTLWNTYAVLDQHGNPPQAAALSDVFDNGVSPHDFFRGTNGWGGFSRTDTTAEMDHSTLPPAPCQAALMEFTNWTNTPALALTVDPSDGYLGGNNQQLMTQLEPKTADGTSDPVAIRIPPYGSMLIAGGYNNGLVFDISLADDCAVVQSLTLHQKECPGDVGSGDTWVDSLASANGCGGASYPFAQSVVVHDSHADTPGILSFGLYAPTLPPPPAPPVISGTQPAAGRQGQSGIAVTIHGTFEPGATCDFGPGITLGAQGCQGGTTTLQAVIAISATAPTGCHDLVVTNPSGLSSTTCFSVNPAQPSIDALSPDSAFPGASLAVTITGSSFQQGATCSFESGSGLSVSSCDYVSANQLTAHVVVAEDATPGPYVLTVADPESIKVATTSFIVLGLAPTLDYVVPYSAVPGQTVNALIHGSNFQPNATCNFGAGVTVRSCAAGDGNQSSVLVATLVIDADAKEGRRLVTITNPDEQVASGYHFRVRAVGSPDITGISPSTVRQGETATLTIAGYDFIGPVTCQVEDCSGSDCVAFEGITVSSCTADSSSQVTAVLTIAADAPVGFPVLSVINDNGRAASSIFALVAAE